MADVIAGRCFVELMIIFNYTVISNIFYVVQTFQQHQNISIFFLSLLTNHKQTTTYLALSDAFAPERSEKKTFGTDYISVPNNILMRAVSFLGYMC
jgi:hypothetical protein